MQFDPLAIKEAQRATWSTGDYADIARLIEDVSGRIVDRLGIASGERVLDVATGTGNAALIAARKGADVVGLDLTPKLLEIAKERAMDASLEIEWIEGDAEELPFADGSFDRATSIFGAMFAPRQGVAAAELARVVKPGGSFATTAWTPEGVNGEFFKVIGAYMPPPPEGFVPPVMWGNEEHVAGLFDGQAELTFERDTILFEDESPEAFLVYAEERLGPVVMARRALEAEGKYEALRGDLLGLYERFNEADDGSLRVQAEYLVTLGTVGG